MGLICCPLKLKTQYEHDTAESVNAGQLDTEDVLDEIRHKAVSSEKKDP